MSAVRLKPYTLRLKRGLNPSLKPYTQTRKLTPKLENSDLQVCFQVARERQRKGKREGRAEGGGERQRGDSARER